MQVGISAMVTGADDAAFVAEAERLGAASVWVPEVWGQDALTPLAYLAARTTTIKLGSAIAALGARTPAMLAGLELVIPVAVEFTDDVEEAAPGQAGR
jgi:alkanesulfonate monooxygenase SsuD/methylene tetrahydromethanopterin reductase-like flavin-dependent oxidoreductase (luciferase family)